MRGMKRVYETIGFENSWDTGNAKPRPSYRSDADRVDWEFYRSLRSDSRRKVFRSGHSFFAFGKDENGYLGGDSVEILSPDEEIVGACNTAGLSNDISIVLRVHHAGKSVLLPGDVEKLAWDNMVNFYGSRLKSDFLKASHHGRDTGYHLEALQMIRPVMTFVSVGRKPSTDASHKYRGQCQQALRLGFMVTSCSPLMTTEHGHGPLSIMRRHNPWIMFPETN
ncbi:predicted hydrolase (plasmid) [Methylobacterium aquaticum]|uniref:Predicted hydrolase n=2 Tax=Methylobacterium aquaticum TaxID=270351 RepID=A0A0C6FV30_9HYPH|nr:predicted hydrolase [Methylobacterium aquaticum]